MSSVPPEYDVEKRDRRYLLKTMKKAMKNKQLDPCNMIKSLYRITYLSVVKILERNAQYSKEMVRSVRTAIELELAEGDAKALTTTLTVAELLEILCISVRWNDTNLLEMTVEYLPEEARISAMSLLERYNLYLDVYDEAVMLKDQLKEVAAAPEVTKALIPVEVTVTKDLSEFTRKDCKEILALLLCQAFKIPRNKILVTEARSGESTTVVFATQKAFMQNVIQYSFEGNSIWAYQELAVTKIRIPGLFEVNVSQLLTLHFKAALRSGLTGDMDFVGATKVCGM